MKPISINAIQYFLHNDSNLSNPTQSLINTANVNTEETHPIAVRMSLVRAFRVFFSPVKDFQIVCILYLSKLKTPLGNISIEPYYNHNDINNPALLLYTDNLQLSHQVHSFSKTGGQCLHRFSYKMATSLVDDKMSCIQ